MDSPDPLPEEEIDMYVAPADIAVEILTAAQADPIPGRAAPARPASVPVLACGPAALMRSSFLSGCADYLRDPWQPEELGIRALGALQLMRRKFELPWGTVSLQGILLQTPAGDVALTLHESRILRALLMGRGSPVPRQALSYFLWGNPGPAGSRAVDVHVAAIRKKVSALVPEAGRFIRAVRREGYLIP